MEELDPDAVLAIAHEAKAMLRKRARGLRASIPAEAIARRSTAIVERLLARQEGSGCFAGADDLRVTHHECDAPWVTPAGQLYVDDRHTITTASVVRVLGRGWERWQ